MLFAAVNVARKLKVDPELALRAAVRPIPRRVQAGGRARRIRAAEAGTIWTPHEQLAYYARARLSEGDPTRTDEPDRARARPADPRQPRQPDGRGGAERPDPAHGDARRCRPARRPASSRRPSCATAARTGWARASARRSRTSTARSRPRSAARTPRNQAALDRMLITLDGTPNKSRLGANAILAVSLAAAHAAAAEQRLPLWRYLGGETRARAAGADDERAQRRRARRQQDRLPGVHDRAGRRAVVQPRRCGWAPRSSTTSSRRSTTQGLSTAVGDEGGFAPDLESNEEALEVLIAGIRAAGYVPGDQVAIALDPADLGALPGRRLRARARGPDAERRRAGRLLGRARGPLPDHLARGRDGRGGLGRLDDAHRAGSATACSSSATTCS